MISSEKVIKSGKIHNCYSCLMNISKGEYYIRVYGNYGNEQYYSATHIDCREAECDYNLNYSLYDWIELEDVYNEDTDWLRDNHPISYMRMTGKKITQISYRKS